MTAKRRFEIPRLTFLTPGFTRRAVFLFVVAFVIYLPALRGPFFWDDDELVYLNADVVQMRGPVHVWYNTEASDYAPLSTISYWFEWGLWKRATLGYHVDNVLLHALNALLLWLVLERLTIPGAFLGAVLFLVHPVCVESVAWISERRNVLSMAWYLSALLAYVEFIGTNNRRYWYTALVLFAAGLFSKAAIVILPIVLLLLVWWVHRRLEKADLWRVAPFAVLSLIVGMVRMWFERNRAMGNIDLHDFTWSRRLTTAGEAVWFYLGKALWPSNLTLIYPRFTESPQLAFLTVAALSVAVGLMVIGMRRRRGRSLAFASSYFVLALLPSLGLANMSYMQHANVADHLEYLALAAPLALLAAVLAKRPRVGIPIAAAIVLVLGAVAARRAWYFGHPDELWQLTARQNPYAWTAHEHIALHLYEKANLTGAADAFKRSLELHPANYRAWFNLATMDQLQGRWADAIDAYSQALARRPTLDVARARINECQRHLSPNAR